MYRVKREMPSRCSGHDEATYIGCCLRKLNVDRTSGRINRTLLACTRSSPVSTPSFHTDNRVRPPPRLTWPFITTVRLPGVASFMTPLRSWGSGDHASSDIPTVFPHSQIAVYKGSILRKYTDCRKSFWGCCHWRIHHGTQKSKNVCMYNLRKYKLHICIINFICIRSQDP